MYLIRFIVQNIRSQHKIWISSGCNLQLGLLLEIFLIRFSAHWTNLRGQIMAWLYCISMSDYFAAK
jgi:hypothetical protein